MKRPGKASPAPALARGLLLLRLLSEGQRLSLATIAERTGWPKPSLLRLLETLRQAGVVARDGDGAWYATAALVPLAAAGQDFADRLVDTLRRLAADTGQTAEWYLPAETGMVLTRRAEPPGGEVRVQARIGFVRPWDDELDAVAAVAIATFQPDRRSFAGLWNYRADGQPGKLSAEQAKALVAAASRDGVAVDRKCNTHGVRRAAAVVFHQARPIGVLALAQHQAPGARARQPKLKQILQAAARQLGGEQVEGSE